ncbi:MAG: patatin-like phospholipase family protein, partial [Pirellulales bacterium]|nr:patatin-like phospholipase family protein [Pirellulales bacterium]
MSAQQSDAIPVPRLTGGGASGPSPSAGWPNTAEALLRSLRQRLHPRRRLNLALQGGGAHGAFTWGALDALLEEDALALDGISGTSAGAVNAVALAAGLMEGGPEGARKCLSRIWNAVSRSAAPSSHPASPLSYAPTAAFTGEFMRRGFSRMSGGWSPYDLNPLSINPLREILEVHVDFERLQRESPVALFIAATEVTTGRARIFRTHEITADVVLASACLPTLFPAVKIGRFLYWDGGFSANPELSTLICETQARDTLLIQISPDRDPERPQTSEQIAGNVARLTFNQPLRREVAQIEQCRRTTRLPLLARRATRRLGGHHYHLIDGSRHTVRLRAETKARPSWPMIEELFGHGQTAARDWSAAHGHDVGRRSSVDLYARYF